VHTPNAYRASLEISMLPVQFYSDQETRLAVHCEGDADADVRLPVHKVRRAVLGCRDDRAFSAFWCVFSGAFVQAAWSTAWATHAHRNKAEIKREIMANSSPQGRQAMSVRPSALT